MVERLIVESGAVSRSRSVLCSLDDAFSASCSPAQVGESPFLDLAIFISLLDIVEQTFAVKIVRKYKFIEAY